MRPTTAVPRGLTAGALALAFGWATGSAAVAAPPPTAAPAAVEGGAWIQLTAGAVTGYFGRRAQYWSERMLDEGRVHLIASDGHNMRRRRPVLSAARDAVALRLGEAAATDMVLGRPEGILLDRSPEEMPALAGVQKQAEQPSGWRRWFEGRR